MPVASEHPPAPVRPREVNPSEALIGLQPLEEILETAIFSAYLLHAIPISLMLVGPSGVAKSKVILQYRSGFGCHITTDVTSSGMQDLLARDNKEEIRFVIIPDFNIVLSHRHATLQLTIANLLSMTSEGAIRIDDGRAVKEVKHSPVGILSAMTPAMYSGIGRKWVALGFARRFLPINYDYSLGTKEKIQHSIAAGLTTMLQLAEKRLVTPPPIVNVKIDDGQSNRLMHFSHDLATNIGWTAVPNRKNINQPKAINTGKQIEFSPHIILRTMARAHALRDGRLEVTDEDIEFCMKLIGFTRFDQPVQL